MTRHFIKQARGSLGLQYKTVIAIDIVSDTVIGSLSSMLWQGDSPISTNDKCIGTVWGVLVNPLYRHRGIGFSMMQACCMHWKSCGCSKGVLIYASEEGKRVYERIGFIPRVKYEYEVSSAMDATEDVLSVNTSAMIQDLKDLLCKEITIDNDYGKLGIDFTNDLHLLWLVMGLQDQLCTVLNLDQDFSLDNNTTCQSILANFYPSLGHPEYPCSPFSSQSSSENEIIKMRKNIFQTVVTIQKKHGTLINPDDNWFTQNITRFGGGFDMQKLATDSQKLASKFDRLATKYDQWVTNNRSKVDNWLVKRIRSYMHTNNCGKQFKCLDIACGIGLPSHTLRLCGMTDAYIIGTDISVGMLAQAKRRRVYDDTFVCNANTGFHNDLSESGCFDLVICMGAMELLDHEIVLAEISRLLRPGGKVWLSFQWENPICWMNSQHPTAHQNVYGVSIEQCNAALDKAGLVLINIDKCCDAFYTPSPKMDGSMNPVPYLFVEAEVSMNHLQKII
jgi:ubiquinone/menaquinone biosynthesis C-methylase UbiE